MISPVPWTRHGYHLAPQFAMLKTKTKEAAPTTLDALISLTHSSFRLRTEKTIMYS